MAAPVTTPPVDDPQELTTALEALQCKTMPVSLDDAEEITKKLSKKHAKKPQAYKHSKRSNRRAMLALFLFGLLLAGILQLATSTPHTRPEPNSGSRANVVFSNALSGTCLAWPPDSPDKPSFVQCSDNHMFEVARPVGMQNFMEPCQLAVRDYLGPHFDPNSKFTSTVLWAGDAGDAKTDERNLLCGLQLPGPDGRPIPFKGTVAEQDQSKVWPPGTCLGLDTATGRSTETPVPCSAPHAFEVAGTVNLRDQFPDARPIEPDQDGFLKDACTRTTDAYLAPVPLNVTGLSINYTLMSTASWNAGSRQVPCTVGIRRGDDGWVPLVGAAKDGVLIDGAAPPLETPTTEVPPPPVEETATVAPTPTTTTTNTAAPSTTTTTTAAPTSSAPSTSSTSSSAPPPAPASASAPLPPAVAPPPTPTTTELPSNMIDTPFGPVVLPWLPAPAPPAG
jgi:hypothetical protein